MGIYILNIRSVWKVKEKQNFRSILHVGLVEYQEISGTVHGIAVWFVICLL